MNSINFYNEQYVRLVQEAYEKRKHYEQRRNSLKGKAARGDYLTLVRKQMHIILKDIFVLTSYSCHLTSFGSNLVCKQLTLD